MGIGGHPVSLSNKSVIWGLTLGSREWGNRWNGREMSLVGADWCHFGRTGTGSTGKLLSGKGGTGEPLLVFLFSPRSKQGSPYKSGTRVKYFKKPGLVSFTS